MRYMIVIEKGPTSYGAHVPDLPGCMAVGETRENVLDLIREAIDFHIEGLREEKLPIPEPGSTGEFVEVSRRKPSTLGGADSMSADESHSCRQQPGDPMTTIELAVPDELFASLRRTPEEFAGEMRVAAAIFWYSRGLLSQERAAQLAGMDRTDFILKLAKEEVDAFVVDMRSLRKELAEDD